LQKGKVSCTDVVKVDDRREPSIVEMPHRQTVGLVGSDAALNHFTIAVDAAAESAAEQTDAQDAEQQPEDETDDEYVEDGRDRLDQRVHYDLTKTSQ